jgi:DMSO/TMAO reductase YedYZ molybdopterin-dependent catalytic subunit
LERQYNKGSVASVLGKEKTMTFRQRHWRHAIVVGLLVMTGLGLYLTTWRSALGPLLPTDQAVHEWGGLVYTAALLGWSARFFPWVGHPSNSPPYTRWAFFFLVMLGVTGVGLLVGPSWTRAVATVGHAAFAAAFILWSLWHLVVAWPVKRRAHPDRAMTWWQQYRLSRRSLLRWMGSAFVAVPAVLALPSMSRVVAGRTVGKLGGLAQNAGALPGFVPYTVVGGYPNIARDDWRLTLFVDDDRRQWTFAEWDRFPKTSLVYTFRCVTGWSVPNVQVTGVNLEQFLLAAGWDPARHPWVLFYSGDGVYTESLSAAQIHQYQPIMASTMDGEPLSVSQGFPVRLLVPNMYGYKSIKWLVGIRLTTEDQLGYWEQRGYPEDAYFGSYWGV